MMKQDMVDVGIYPEGTRSKSGELLEFKDGAFLLAKKADAPLVIMTARNTDRVKKRAPFRHTRVELRILEVLDRETVKSLPIDVLSARIRERMLEDLGS